MFCILSTQILHRDTYASRCGNDFEEIVQCLRILYVPASGVSDSFDKNVAAASVMNIGLHFANTLQIFATASVAYISDR